MLRIIFLLIALVSVTTMQAREMIPQEAEERAQIVTMGGD